MAIFLIFVIFKLDVDLHVQSFPTYANRITNEKIKFEEELN